MASVTPLRELVPTLKKSVVNIEKNVAYGLCGDKYVREHADLLKNSEVNRQSTNSEISVGNFFGTGFIVDSKLGIVATNDHVAGLSPCQLSVTFENGESCQARRLHGDAWHDFAFIQLNMEEITWPLVEVKLGESASLKDQDECCLIGNNDGEEYSVKFGVVTNRSLDRGQFHSHCFQTSFDRTGGSSGSPVFNTSGEVIGIHKTGTNTTSIELRVEYITDAMSQIRAGKIQRGTIGLELKLERLSTVIKHCSFPKELAEKIRNDLGDDIKHVLRVSVMTPGGSAEAKLKPGDILYQINGTMIGNNMYRFDKIVDENTGGQVELVIYRNGSQMTFNVDVVDTELQKVNRFALYAGGVFHELTPNLRSEFWIHGPGIFLNQVAEGSCLADLGEGTKTAPTSFVVVLQEFDGMRTHSLQEFIDAVTKVGNDKKFIYSLSRNLRDYCSATLTTYISLDLQFEPLRVFSWDSKLLEWVEEGDSGKKLVTKTQPADEDDDSDEDDTSNSNSDESTSETDEAD